MNKLVFKLFYPRSIFLAFIAIIGVFLIGCSITGKAVDIPKETRKSPEVYFCPGDDCSLILESKINNASHSVHCAFYDLDLKNVINALAKKSKQADVKLVMDSSNYESQVSGNAVRLDDNNQLMHNKFCIIDDKLIATGSFNPTENDNYKNNNNLIIIHSKNLASNFEDEFNELWNGKFGKGSNVKNPAVYVNNIKIGNYFCPEDKCASHVADIINNAEKSIYFMTFSFTSEEIADAIIKKDGLEIKGIFDSMQASSGYSQLERLQGFGIDVKKDSGKYKLHHKVFIVDNQTVITGSFNPTQSGDSRNDENLLIIHDKEIAGLFLDEFDTLWE